MASLGAALPHRLILFAILCWPWSLAAVAAPLQLGTAMDDVRLWPSMEILLEPVATAELIARREAYPFRPVTADESIDGLAIGVEPLVVADGTLAPDAIKPLRHRSRLFEITTPVHAEQQIYVRRSAPERLVFRADQWRAWSPSTTSSASTTPTAMPRAIWC